MGMILSKWLSACPERESFFYLNYSAIMFSDHINYTMVLQHNSKSKLDALEIVIAIILPASVRFDVLSTANRSSYSYKLINKNHAEFKVYNYLDFHIISLLNIE